MLLATLINIRAAFRWSSCWICIWNTCTHQLQHTICKNPAAGINANSKDSEKQVLPVIQHNIN